MSGGRITPITGEDPDDDDDDLLADDVVGNLARIHTVVANGTSITSDDGDGSAGAESRLRRCYGNTPPLDKLAVSFGDVLIREFPPMIGHNPFVSSGVPIALDYCSNTTTSDEEVPTNVARTTRTRVDIYESRRQHLRRCGKALLIRKQDRERMYVSTTTTPRRPRNYHSSIVFTYWLTLLLLCLSPTLSLSLS